ncbi:hypothetical protein SAMD00019534_110390 [Acytostelium subglobosum LB1]|uniref:hypothetical protein n=1 Tax=Acytostelium subglobosum LB1 TaxID=1410327 RepID=UPI000644900C|nr:hypothetical protein SAMD00019534_110390 [Acytostelium subglobosum LB1]GAM27863.1 hypothetical protein SAMD00019534_110390 [Acytostelium subglobosum LB1]|eukprot:XP_012749146.1 hypothetical protein SAMD00019534_110390 [Acytostelium subglobosum LB1]
MTIEELQGTVNNINSLIKSQENGGTLICTGLLSVVFFISLAITTAFTDRSGPWWKIFLGLFTITFIIAIILKANWYSKRTKLIEEGIMEANKQYAARHITFSKYIKVSHHKNKRDRIHIKVEFPVPVVGVAPVFAPIVQTVIIPQNGIEMDRFLPQHAYMVPQPMMNFLPQAGPGQYEQLPQQLPPQQLPQQEQPQYQIQLTIDPNNNDVGSEEKISLLK